MLNEFHRKSLFTYDEQNAQAVLVYYIIQLPLEDTYLNNSLTLDMKKTLNYM